MRTIGQCCASCHTESEAAEIGIGEDHSGCAGVRHP